MKKIFAVLFAVLCISVAANAQSRAVGVRMGYGGEISYQHDLGANFGEFDLGWYSHGFSVTGVYNFLFPIANDFNFYVGPGAQLGFYNYDDVSGLDLGLAGMVGVEFNLPTVPIQFSLDWRPVFRLRGHFGYDSVGLGIRYRF